MDLRQIRHFATLASTLNFRRAAALLHIAQPALSVSIRRLEEDMGVQLFTRGRRGVALTSEGRAALPDAIKAMDSAQRMRQQATAASQGAVGTLTLAYVGTATYDLLPRALERLRTTAPGIRVALHEANTDAIVAGLEARRFDVGIVRYPMRSVPEMTLELVQDDRYNAALPPGHRLAGKASFSLKELANEQFLVPAMAQNPSLYHTVLQACQTAGFMPKLAAEEAVQVSTVLALVESGFGVALIPESIALRVKRRVTFHRLKGPSGQIATGLGLLYPVGPLSPLTGGFRAAILSLKTPSP
jgi:DNA-binding transcriptional LysR family regulator